MKLTAKDVTATRNIHGAWVISALVNGYLVTRTYYWYTKREAIRLFLNEVKDA